MAAPPDGATRLDVHVPLGLFDVIVGLSQRNRRPMVDEVVHALERHARQPPTVTHHTTGDAPELEPSAAVARTVPGRKARKRGPA